MGYIISDHCVGSAAAGRSAAGAAAATRQFRASLLRSGVIAEDRPALTPAAECAQQFEEYLIEQRSLAPAIVDTYVQSRKAKTAANRSRR